MIDGDRPLAESESRKYLIHRVSNGFAEQRLPDDVMRSFFESLQRIYVSVKPFQYVAACLLANHRVSCFRFAVTCQTLSNQQIRTYDNFFHVLPPRSLCLHMPSLLSRQSLHSRDQFYWSIFHLDILSTPWTRQSHVERKPSSQ